MSHRFLKVNLRQYLPTEVTRRPETEIDIFLSWLQTEVRCSPYLLVPLNEFKWQVNRIIRQLLNEEPRAKLNNQAVLGAAIEQPMGRPCGGKLIELATIVKDDGKVDVGATMAANQTSYYYTRKALRKLGLL